jgi:PPOX class probable F420-dependent enzyme
MLPESHRDLLSDEVRAFAFLATVMPDGTPQVTPVWFDTEGELIRVNTARGRVKDRNMAARPQVSLAIIDPTKMYRYIQIRGTVESISEEGSRDHIDKLARKYRGTPTYDWYRGEQRVIYRIRPRSANSMG